MYHGTAASFSKFSSNLHDFRLLIKSWGIYLRHCALFIYTNSIRCHAGHQVQTSTFRQMQPGILGPSSK